MSPQLHELWLEHAVAAFDRQLHLAQWLGEHDWQWETESGLLLLRRHAYPDEIVTFTTQALGSESHMAETWLWIWANDLAELPANLLKVAHKLREQGENRGIPEFTQSEFALTEADGHVLSLVAVGLQNGAAYYRGPYVGGAGFVLIENPQSAPASPFPALPVADATRVCGVFRAALASLPIDDQRRAFIAYVRHLGWQIEEHDTAISGRNGGEQVEASFDESGQLLGLNIVS